MCLAVVEEAAGSSDVDTGAVAGVGCGCKLGSHGCNAYNLVIATGIVITGFAFVTHGEDAKAAGHVVGVRLCGEIVDCVEHGLFIIAYSRPAP